MTAQLSTPDCGVGMIHDPHAYLITSAGATPWLVVCMGKARPITTNHPAGEATR